MSTGYYARVSTPGQELAHSIEGQLHLIRAYLDSQGIKASPFIDDGVTGMLDLWERPAGKRLWDAAKAGQITRLIVYKLDRLGRGNDARLLLNVVYGLRDLGVSVVSLTEMIDTGTPAGELFLGMLASFASYERKMILERTKLGKARVARDGQWWGGPPPYGYRLEKDGLKTRLVIDEKSAATVRDIFARTRAGETLMQLAQWLNAAGIPTGFQLRGSKGGEARLGVWHNSAVRKILRNDIYTGSHAYRARDDEMVTVPGIITREEYEEAQAAIVKNRTEAKRNTRHDYLLRGLLRCGRCGRVITCKMVSRPAGQKASYYYRCNATPRREAEALRCRLPYLPAESLEARAWALCLAFLLHPETVLQAAAVPQAEDDGNEDELPALARRMAEIEAARARTIDLYSRERITAEETDRQLDRLASEKATLENRRRALSHQTTASEAPDLLAVAAALRARLQADDPPFDLKREIVKLLERQITVNVEGKEIILNAETVFGTVRG
ncbi:MAG: recombinase family protein [Armatimonadota bacterium]